MVCGRRLGAAEAALTGSDGGWSDSGGGWSDSGGEWWLVRAERGESREGGIDDTN